MSSLAIAALLTSGCWYLPSAPLPSEEDDDGGQLFEPVDAGDVDAGMRGLDRATCTWNGKKLYGLVRYVDFNPDIRVRVVTSLARLHVREVSSLANRCGKS